MIGKCRQAEDVCIMWWWMSQTLNRAAGKFNGCFSCLISYYKRSLIVLAHMINVSSCIFMGYVYNMCFVCSSFQAIPRFTTRCEFRFVVEYRYFSRKLFWAVLLGRGLCIGALTTLVAHFSTIYCSGMAEIHARSAILNKQITKSSQHFYTCILWIWNRIHFFFF